MDQRLVFDPDRVRTDQDPGRGPGGHRLVDGGGEQIRKRVDEVAVEGAWGHDGVRELPHDTGLRQDLNGDGVALLMAYALELDPRQNLASRLPIPVLDTDGFRAAMAPRDSPQRFLRLVVE